MKIRTKRNPAERPERVQNQLLFWLAAALAPESLPWYSGGLSRSVLGEIELARRAAESAPAAQEATTDESVEAQRRAA